MDDETVEFLIGLENEMTKKDIATNIKPVADTMEFVLNANPLLFERLLISYSNELPYLVMALLVERQQLRDLKDLKEQQ